MSDRGPAGGDGSRFRRRQSDPGDRAAVDRYRRLRGEPPLDLASLAEAVHWTRVYGEMLRFSERARRQADRLLEQVSPDTRAELAAAELAPLQARCERLRRRLRLWRQRADELLDRGRNGGTAAGGG